MKLAFLVSQTQVYQYSQYGGFRTEFWRQAHKFLYNGIWDAEKLSSLSPVPNQTVRLTCIAYLPLFATCITIYFTNQQCCIKSLIYMTSLARATGAP